MKFDLRKFSAFLLVAVVAMQITGLMLSTMAAPSSTFTISGGVYPGAPSYTIWAEGGNYFAKDKNGLLAYEGTNASQIIDNVFDVLNLNGGTAFFRSGVYELTTSLSYSVIGGTEGSFKIIGENAYTTILNGSALASPTLTLNTFTSFVISDITIEGGLKINGGSGYRLSNNYFGFYRNTENSPLLHLSSVCDSEIDNNWFIFGSSGGLLIDGGGLNNALRISGNEYAGNNLYQIKITNAADISIIDSAIEIGNTSNPGFGLGHGIFINASDNIRVIGNKIAGFATTSYDVLKATGVVSDYSTTLKISNNDIWGTDYASLEHNVFFDYVKNSTFIGNTLSMPSIGPHATLFASSNAESNIFIGNINLYGNVTISGSYNVAEHNKGFP